MNKAEKKFAQKISANFRSSANSSFTTEENMILERWRAYKIINEDAFIDITSMGSGHKEYLQGMNYPFTSFGDEEIKKDWYLQFRDSNGVKIIRDIFTVIAFFASLFALIYGLFDK
jgi:hypothetical protein